MDPATNESARSLALSGDVVGAVKLWRTRTGQDFATSLAAVQALLASTAPAPLTDEPQQRSRQATAKFASGTGNTTSFEKGKLWLGRAEAGGSAVGFSDDRHVITLAGTRSGKGTSAIIPNLIEYPGSIICIDPKGENATVTAQRRANGSAYAFGMGQRVVVLDPFGVADVPDELRGAFNPLDLVDVSTHDAIDRAKTIADALVVLDDPKDMHWAESARQLLAALVLFAKLVGPEGSHHLAYVRTLLTRGFVVPESEDGTKPTTVSGFDYMLQFMRECEECGGVIASAAETLLAMGTDERGSVLSFARRNTAFLDSPRMQQCIGSSSFALADLKRAPTGLSLYLCLPARELQNHGRWLRLIVLLGLVEMERLGHQPPATGHPVLFLLDEFASLGHMRPVEVAAAYIAGYGVKLWLILQDLQQLKGTYEKSWATFVGNAGLLQAFCNTDQPTLEYLSKRLGETEFRQITRNSSESRSSTTSESTSESYSSGTSSTRSSDKSLSREPRGLFFLGKRTGETRTQGGSQSSDSSTTHGTSRDYSDTTGREAGFSESVVVAPLMRPDEIERRFNKASMQQLIVVAGDDPVVLSRSDYFRDEHFDSKFDPHPAYPESAPLTLEEKARRAQEALNRRLELAEAEKQRALEELQRLRENPPKVAASSGLTTWHKASLVVGCVALVLLIARISNKGSDPAPLALAAAPSPSTADAVPAAVAAARATAGEAPSAPAPMPAPAPTPTPTAAAAPGAYMTVAAVAANVRREAGGMGSGFLVLNRGDRVEVLAASDGVYQVRVPSGQVGWISEKVVIDTQHHDRLQGTTAADYIEAQRSRLEGALLQMRAVGGDVDAALGNLVRDPAETLHQVLRTMSSAGLRVDADLAASKWFGLMAEFEEKSGRLVDATANALAAMTADPLNPDHFHRYLILHYRLGNLDEVKKLALVGTMLAPNSSNSWMLMGIADATANRAERAAGAFRLAVQVSRSPPSTQRYFQDLAGSSSDGRISAAIRDALANP